MKLALIGGHGHHSLLQLAAPGGNLELVALAGDGRDNEVLKFQSSPAWHSGVACFPHFEQMLDEVQPGIVSIGCQYAFHAAACRAALARNIPAVCEKPVANTLEELEELDILSRSSQARVIPEFTMRWQPAFSAAASAVRSGGIGDVVLVSGQKSYPFKIRPSFYQTRETYCGTIPWVGIHAIDFVRWCSGREYETVTAIHGNHSQPDYPGCEDHAVLLCEMSGGACAVITADFLRPTTAPSRNDDRLRIMGTCGSLEVRDGVCRLCEEGSPERLLTMPEQDAAQGLLDCALGQSAFLTWHDAHVATRLALLARDFADRPGEQTFPSAPTIL